MHVNVRKDICFPSACIRFGLTHIHSRAHILRTQSAHGVYSYVLREIHACEPYTCVTSARCSYVRMHLKEILPDVLRRLFLIQPLLSFCRDFLQDEYTKRKYKSNEGICWRQSRTSSLQLHERRKRQNHRYFPIKKGTSRKL